MNELRRAPETPGGADLRRLSDHALDLSRPAYDPMAELARSRGPRQLEDWQADDYGHSIWRHATDQLDPAQRDALRNYTRESVSGVTCYRQINKFLRGSGTASPEIDDHIRKIDAAQAIVPVPEDLIVVRGTTERAFARPVRVLKGEVITEDGYLSTSIGRTPAFDNLIWMHLSVPKGTPAIYLEAVTYCPGERELLLGRGLTYTVDRVERDEVRGKWQVHGRIHAPHEQERNRP